MAIPYDPNLKKQQEEDAQQTESSGSGTVISGENASAGSDGGAGTADGQQKPSSSGSFTNLQSYLTANEGRDFGGQVAGKVTEDVNAATQAQSDAGNSFKQKADAQTVNWNPDLVNKAKTDAVSVANDPTQTAQFKQMRDASYGGPKSFVDDSANYMNANAATQKGSQAGAFTQDESGRKALLQNYYAAPKYNSGQQNLDNLLLQNDPNAQSKLSAASAQAAGLQNSFGKLTNDLNSYGKTAADTTKATHDNLNNTFVGANGLLPGMENTLNTRLSTNTANQNNHLSSLQAALASGQISAADAQLLGFKDGQETYHTDPGSLLSKTAAPTLNSVTTGDEAAKYNALNSLMDRQGLLALNSNQAYGGYDPTKDLSFNRADFDTKFGQDDAAYKSAMAPIDADQKPWEASRDYLNQLMPNPNMLDDRSKADLAAYNANIAEDEKKRAALNGQWKHTLSVK